MGSIYKVILKVLACILKKILGVLFLNTKMPLLRGGKSLIVAFINEVIGSELKEGFVCGWGGVVFKVDMILFWSIK